MRRALLDRDEIRAVDLPNRQEHVHFACAPAQSIFLRAEPSRIHSHSHLDPKTLVLDSQDASSYASDASSIARFPDFHFNLHLLTTVHALCPERSGIASGCQTMRLL
ncbi:hypothetical protein FA95DRAFT_1566314 [Auriscalpium vulgare]|uniref:Uncharacterized protein n=1 Tax=Auriscalpium vulgare TaxID=40419 RepID=A0ACB8R8X2_9AGAM|nr:hypothetical protein FA95DRAFT_1566314 [Auriscalpium vulgare]